MRVLFETLGSRKGYAGLLGPSGMKKMGLRRSGGAALKLLWRRKNGAHSGVADLIKFAKFTSTTAYPIDSVNNLKFRGFLIDFDETWTGRSAGRDAKKKRRSPGNWKAFQVIDRAIPTFTKLWGSIPLMCCPKMCVIAVQGVNSVEAAA